MLAAVTLLTMLSSGSAAPPGFLTLAEQTEFVETSRYEETLAYCRRLERESRWIRTTSFGVSPEGRELILVIASKDRAFDPAAAAKTGKPIILIQAGIHAGEIDGKDAGLMLLRDIAVTGRYPALLDHTIILFMPIYNVDGHERFGPHNRINQNGPKEMGWRVTSRNLNLNRDYMKADAVETRAWLRLFTSWQPDLLVDCHVTDGADYRYDVTYAFESGPNAPRPVAEWIERAVNEHVAPALETAGHLPAPYVSLKDDTDPAAGMTAFPATPRFSTAYATLQNRPAFLVETHMLKDYRSRVVATYDTLRYLIEEVGRDADALREAVRSAERLAASPGSLPLTFKPSPRSRKAAFKGIAYRRELSEISGAMRIIYGSEPLDLQVEIPDGIEPVVVIEKPLAYIVPPQWTEAIEVLGLHGLRLRRLAAPATVEVDSYKLSEPRWQAAPFEGRHPLTVKAERLQGQRRSYPAGSVVVPMDQAPSAVAAHLLEPQGPDSFVAWGFFDSIFEQKEYAEAYVMEVLSRELLAKDPNLRAGFERALAEPEFAASPVRRLDFFFRRSPWWDERIGLYPVGLVTTPLDLPLEPLR